MNNKIDWSKLLNWQLLSGSHEFPGPEGGTCINEAAVVASGFEYREVQSVDDLPECFSRILGGLALTINDEMGEDEKANERRTRLLSPFVTRLAGSADTPLIEEQRLDVFVNALYHDILESVMNYEHCEPVLRHARTIPDLKNVAGLLAVVLWEKAPLMNTQGASDLAKALVTYDARGYAGNYSSATAQVIHSLINLGGAVANVKGKSVEDYWARVVDYLRQAFELGNQATPVDVNAVVERVKEMRVRAQAATLTMEETVG